MASKTRKIASNQNVGSAPKPTEPAKEQPKQKQTSVFIPLIFGGAVAAALGMVGSELGVIGGSDSEVTALRAQISEQQDRIKALEAAKPKGDQALVEEFRAELDLRLSKLEADIDASQKSIAELDARPIFTGNADVDTATYEKQLVALQQSVQQQRDEIDTLFKTTKSAEEATAASARRAAAQTALSQVVSAIDAGRPFDAPLAELNQAGVNVPEALTNTATTGVASLASLQESFPATARAALTAARQKGEADEPAGLGSFLKQQLGARSITPQEGDSPDAVLSRAEAALKAGDLSQSLTELDTLTPSAREAMAEWINRATTRSAARKAVSDISQSLNES